MNKALYLAITDIIIRHKKDVDKKKLEQLIDQIIEIIERS